MAPHVDSGGDDSDEDYEDDASLCDFLESEVLGDQEPDDVDSHATDGEKAFASNGEDALATTQVSINFFLLLVLLQYFILKLRIILMFGDVESHPVNSLHLIS